MGFGDSDQYKNAVIAASYHFKSFKSSKDATKWYTYEYSQQKKANDRRLIPTFEGEMARHPFQFLSNILRIENYEYNVTPITQDASASAYQIMSYLLLDDFMAKKTNVIPNEEGCIHDVYIFLLEELLIFMSYELGEGNHLLEVCKKHLNRKIVKGIFMPLIYGKTLMSIANDLRDHLSHFITYKECYSIASLCLKFWKSQCCNMDCLITLIKNIGWIASSGNNPVH